MSWSLYLPAITALAHSQPIVLIAVLLVVLLIARAVYRTQKSPDFPRVGRTTHWYWGLLAARAEFMRNSKQMVEEAYGKYKNSVYIVQTGDMERVVLSTKYLQELRTYPKSVLSHRQALVERHLAHWNTLDVVEHSNLHVDVVRKQLNQQLPRLVPKLAEEAHLAWTTELAKCTKENSGYEYLPANAVVHNVVATLVNRAIVGTPVCHDREWFHVSLAYARNAFAIATALRPWPEAMRHVVFPFLESRKALRSTMTRAVELLVPAIEARQRHDSDNLDALQWMMDRAGGADGDPKELVHKALFLCLASIVSSSMGVTHAIYDLCTYPGHMELLREELETVLEEEGGWTLRALQKMHRLDSFLRESQRINHPGIFTFNRKVMQDITLSDGIRLRAGTFISIPTFCTALDSDNYSDPMCFDPLRFVRLRQKYPNSEDDYLFTSITTSNLGWGHGTHACPGRFFAAAEMKIAIAVLLLNYDFKFPSGQSKRPDNIYLDERIYPHRTQEIGFRSRKAGF